MRSTRHRTRILAGVALLLLAGLVSGNQAKADDDDIITGEILAELQPGVAPEAIAERYGLELLDGVPLLTTWLYRAPDGADVASILVQMESDPDISEAESHRETEDPEGGQRTIPDLDRSLGPSDYQGQVAAQTLHTAAAQQVQTGAGVTVAVIDTGFNLNHPTLRPRLINSRRNFADGAQTGVTVQANGLDDDADGQIDESKQHATFVAGMVHLAAPDARILAIRALDADGRGSAFGVANAIMAALERGADVINLSFGMTHRSRIVEKAVETAVDAGAVVVAAAGNQGGTLISFPARMDETIAVASVDDSLVRASWSNYGPEVTLSAPGLRLISTHRQAEFARWDGTSFSNGLVAGAAALLLDRYPGLTPVEVADWLRSTAQPDQNPPSLDGLMGGGVIDLEGLVDVLTQDRSSLDLQEGLDGTALDWSPLSGAVAYDVARGDVGALRVASGAVDLGSLVCLGDDLPGTAPDGPDAALPLPGEAFFYVFRDDAQEEPDTWGESDSGQQRRASGGDCLAPTES